MKNYKELLKLLYFGLLIIFMSSFIQNNIKTKRIKKMYSKTRLNIRQQPSINSKVLTTLNPNSLVLTYDSIVNSFISVLSNDSTFYGWASKKYLQEYMLSKKQLETPQSGKQKNGNLKYHIIKKQKVGFANSNRMVYRIIVDVSRIPSLNEMKQTATYIWKNGNKKWSEFTVFVYLPGMDLKYSAYGIFEFDPSGITNYYKLESSLYDTKWE